MARREKKTHNFQLHSYKHPKWCDHCHEFLWGFINQGYRCKDCLLSVHKGCKERLTKPCTTKHKLKQSQTIDIPEVPSSHGAVKPERSLSPSLPVFNIKCAYFRKCSSYLSAFEVRDQYVDMASPATKCFCDTCIDAHVIGENCEITLQCYPGWTVHRFSSSLDDPLARDVTNWEIVYFSIKPQFARKLLDECFTPSTTTGGGDIDLLVAKSFEHTVEDLVSENYSHKFHNSETGSHSFAQCVLEMYVSPSGYERIVLSHGEPVFEDSCDLQKHHVRVKNTKFIYPKSALLRIFSEESKS